MFCINPIDLLILSSKYRSLSFFSLARVWRLTEASLRLVSSRIYKRRPWPRFVCFWHWPLIKLGTRFFQIKNTKQTTLYISDLHAIWRIETRRLDRAIFALGFFFSLFNFFFGVLINLFTLFLFIFNWKGAGTLDARFWI